jgi:hypothetical protein
MQAGHIDLNSLAIIADHLKRTETFSLLLLNHMEGGGVGFKVLMQWDICGLRAQDGSTMCRSHVQPHKL